jgi:hypothetical protein
LEEADFTKEIMMPKESRKQYLLLGVAVTLCAGAAPAAAQTFVGNNFSPGSGLLAAVQSFGFEDEVPPFVILQEYSPSGPATTGAIFTSAGTVNDVTYYGGGAYDLNVYTLAPDPSPGANELAFTVVGDENFTGNATTTGVHTLPVLASSSLASVQAGDYLAFAGIGPYYPQRRMTPEAPTRHTKALRNLTLSSPPRRHWAKPSPSAPTATRTPRTTSAPIFTPTRVALTRSASPTRHRRRRADRARVVPAAAAQSHI